MLCNKFDALEGSAKKQLRQDTVSIVTMVCIAWLRVTKVEPEVPQGGKMESEEDEVINLMTEPDTILGKL